MTSSKLIDLSTDFAVAILKLSNELRQKKEKIISNQICRSGTSIGANIHEAQYAQSRADFINKLQIALKEANETKYWLEILSESGYLEVEQIKVAYGLCQECLRLLMAITAKQKKL